MRGPSEGDGVDGIDDGLNQADLGGFDIGFAPDIRVDLEAPLNSAKAWLDGWRGRVAQELVGRISSTAGATARYGQVIGDALVAPLAEARSTVDRVGDVVLSDLVGTLASVNEASRRYGAWVSPESPAVLPGDVIQQRATRAIPGLVNPPSPTGYPYVTDATGYNALLKRLKEDVAPWLRVDPSRFYRGVDWLASELPDGSPYVASFSQAVRDVAALPLNSLGPAPSTAPAWDPTWSPTGWPTSSPGGVSSGSPVAPPASPGGGGGQIPGAPVWGPPGGAAQPPAVSGGAGPIAGGPAGPGGPIAGGAGGFPGGLPGAGAPGPTGTPIDGIDRLLCPTAGTPVFHPDGSMTCELGGAGGLLPPGGGPSGPIGGPIAGGPTAPGGQCVTICGLDQLIDAIKGPKVDQAKCPKYRAWRSAESGDCYVQRAEVSPRNQGDKLLAESDAPDALVNAVLSACGAKKERKPEAKPPATVEGGAVAPACDWILPPTVAPAATGKNPIGELLGLDDGEGNYVPPLQGSGLTSVATTVANTLLGFVHKQSEFVWKGISGLFSGQPCWSGQMAGLLGTRSLLGFLSRWIGVPTESMETPLAQNQNFLCPVQMPGVTDAHRSYLAGEIDEGTWRCWVRAAGGRDELFNSVLQASRAKLDPTQIVSLARRGAIPEASVPARLRELGFLRDSDYAEWRELGRAIPGPGDVVSFMLRDVDDPGVVGRFRLDEQFGDKFQGKVREYAQANGIDTDLMLRYWRAHWSIPSPTQLYEMYHRLRNLPDGDPAKVTLEDVTIALNQQDIAPFWVDKLLAVSFRPLRLVDTQRAFQMGVIDAEDVRKTYQSLGYSDQDADRLVEFQKRQKTQAARKSQVVKWYAQGTINSQILEESLQYQGFDQADRQAALLWGKAEMLRSRTKACSQAIRRRMLRGEFDPDQGATRLQDLGLDADQAMILSEAWNCERRTKYKDFSASQVCKMYTRGLIDGPEYVNRLERLGWDHDDAVRLYAACSQDVEASRRKAELAAIRKAEAKALKDAKAVSQATKKLLGEIAANDKRQKSIDRLNDARRKAMVEAGQVWSKRTGLPLDDSIQAAKGIYKSVVKSAAVSQAVAIRVLVTAAHDKQLATIDEWANAALEAARILEGDDPNRPGDEPA